MTLPQKAFLETPATPTLAVREEIDAYNAFSALDETGDRKFRAVAVLCRATRTLSPLVLWVTSVRMLVQLSCAPLSRATCYDR